MYGRFVGSSDPLHLEVLLVLDDGFWGDAA